MKNCPECSAVLTEETQIQAAEVLAEHYQKTFELNHSLWEERNKNFLILLLVAGFEILITYRTPSLTSFFTDLYNHFIAPTPSKTTEDISQGFPFQLLQTILLMVILYLLIQIYHRTTHIKRTYNYLKELETDIRAALASHAGTHSFTREGDYYYNPDNQPQLMKLTGIIYSLLLGALLLLVSFGGFWMGDSATGKSALDWFIIAIIFLYFGHYFYLAAKSVFTNPAKLDNSKVDKT